MDNHQRALTDFIAKTIASMPESSLNDLRIKLQVEEVFRSDLAFAIADFDQQEFQTRCLGNA